MSGSDSEDDFEHDGDEEGLDEVELGFVSKIAGPLEDALLHDSSDWAEWDGGLVGGAPKWLNPATVPSTQALACTDCALPLSFLMQIYCPLDDQPDAFHRTLYLFCCRKPGCSKQGSGKTFRAQLPVVNPFYPETSGVEGFQMLEAAAAMPSLCALCGQRAVFTCSACHVAQYCSKEHQKDHWNHGHKADCAKCHEKNELIESESSRLALRDKGSKWVFPQYEIEIEHEPDANEAANEHEAKLLADFEQNKRLAAARVNVSASDESDPFTDDSEIDMTQKDLNEALGSTAKHDKAYVRFLTRVELAKDQVLRYARWQDDSVLWVHSGATLSADAVPACPRCGASRKFEFQVLPQLLFYLRVDQSSSLHEIGEKSCDWGTLVVYTCSMSCALENEYAEEFVHFQTPYAGE